jgi:hypothetical protein
MNKFLRLGVAGLLLAGSMFAQDELNQPGRGNENDFRPAGRGNFPHGRAGAGSGAAATQPITYHGGPVMNAATTNVYFIYYGTWSPTQKGILTNFASSISGSPYFNIETSYYDSANKYVQNSVTYVGGVGGYVSTYVAAKPTNLTDSDIAGIVQRAVTTDGAPVDVNGVYFVLTGAGVGESSGFLSSYCGWHTYGTISGSKLKYSFVGNASANLAVCAAQTASSPNNDPAVDAMISVIAHELDESVSDPLLNAWYDASGEENADKCAWTFGSTFAAPNGSAANVTFNGFNFLIQQNWANSGAGYCALSYAAAPDYSLSVTNAPSIQQGQTTTNYTVKVNPTNGFTGSVDLAVSGLPANATASGPGSTNGTATFTIVTTGAVNAGTYNFTITGSYNGLTNHTVQGILTVNTTGTMSVSIAPGSLTVTRGTSKTYTVTVTGTGGFNSNTQLSVSGLPSRVTGNFSPNPVVGGNGTSTLTISAQSTARAATRTITVTAVGGGLTKTTTATLVIN